MQWCDIFGIEMVDLDGPLRSHKDLNTSPVSLDTFVDGIAECTINPINRDKYSVLEKLF